MLDFYSKKLSTPGVFPIKLQDDELQWKISLGYDVPSDSFNLRINDLHFLQMPYQAEIRLNGPQNIDDATITLNGVEVLNGFA